MSISKLDFAIAVSGLTLAFGTTSHAQILQDTSPAWSLKPAINPVPNWYEVRGGAWRVPTEIVTQMASRIKTEVGASVLARLDTYVIQYQGVTAGATRAIRLMGACNKQGASERTFSDRFYVVFDGGTCYFDATYDPDEQRFTSLNYHGHA